MLNRWAQQALKSNIIQSKGEYRSICRAETTEYNAKDASDDLHLPFLLLIRYS